VAQRLGTSLFEQLGIYPIPFLDRCIKGGLILTAHHSDIGTMV
jgi:hypothetical protein